MSGPPPRTDRIETGRFIAGFPASWLAGLGLAPWELTARAREIVGEALGRLPSGYRVEDGVALHGSAAVEAGAVIKGPAIVGPGCRIAAGAYLRDGCWLEAECRIGPGSEVKSSFLFARASAAHFNFVGDSLLGAAVNLEAGAVLANHRNEDADPRIALVVEGRRIETGAAKFGALVGDGCKVGANAVLAPGTVLPPATIVPRLALVDQR